MENGKSSKIIFFNIILAVFLLPVFCYGYNNETTHPALTKETIDIFIPAGIDTNQVIRIEGKGEAGKKGGKPGNLFVRIFVKKHHIFERREDDLYTSVQIGFSQAAMGGEIEVSTLEGDMPAGRQAKILLNIPAGTESEKIFKISGKGIPHFGGYGRGNLFVELKIKTPKKLSRKQKELLEELKKEGL